MEKEKTKSIYEVAFKADYLSDWDVHKSYIQEFDSYEAMLMGEVYDSVSSKVSSGKITDSYATTLAKERADRVIAKLPDGVVEPAGSSDVGKAALMDILRQKWIYPNANAQHNFLEKLNMWQFYSSVYGYMPMFYDWNVSSTGYVGPDCWLWSPRNLIPQQGRASIAEMDYVTAVTWVGKSYLQDVVDGEVDETDEGGWDHEAIAELLESAEKETGQDVHQDSRVTRNRNQGTVKKGICLATRFEAGEDGEWITFAPDHGFQEVRRLKNPHKNGRIPFVIKYSQPLFDSFYGLGDFQRAKPLQFARDGLINFYFKGIKMNLIPPIVANANGVVKQTLDYREGGVMLEMIPNSIRRLETSTAGLATFQAAQSNLTGSLLSLFGTQNASIPGAESLNPEQGKTPAAIGMYSDKEATRDGAERRHLETAIQELTHGFFSMVVNIGADDIPVTLFNQDIKDIINSGMSDLAEIFHEVKPNETETAGVLTINPKKLKGVEYRFQINPDSTLKINKDAQLASLLEMIDRLGKYQNILKEDPRITIHWDKIMKTYKSLSNVPGAEDFITFTDDATAQPSPTAIDMPNGGKLEASELVRMYQATQDPQERQQIAQTLGLNPTTPQPTVTPSGHMFQDPGVAQAATALFQNSQMPAPSATPATSATMQ